MRRIAARRGSTLTAIIREHLQRIATEEDDSGPKRREMEALERTFSKVSVSRESAHLQTGRTA
jgi:hypothetical protein